MAKDLEKENKKLKKKNKAGGKIILFLLLIILILFLIIFLFDPFGFGGGMGILLGGNSTSGTESAPGAASTSASTEETEKQAAEPVIVYVNVTVSGTTYLLADNESTVDEIVAAVKDKGEDVIVQITDDSATVNAMDALTAALDENGISYSIG